MPCCDKVRTARFGKFPKHAKLHMTVTHHIRVRRIAFEVLRNHVFANSSFVRFFGVAGKERDFERCRNTHCVESFLLPITHEKVRLPCLNKHANNLMPLCLEHVRRYRRINTSRKSDRKSTRL